MLSQKAWRCGRSFIGTKNAPSEFREIEHELARLAKSLKVLAECLFSEEVEILLSLAEEFTTNGIRLVIDYCKHTLSNLESLIEQYQSQGTDGFSVQKGWSEVVLHNFKQLIWTADGGSIYILRDILHMHVSTTAVIRQALERLDSLILVFSLPTNMSCSKSRDRVEWTVAPVAERIQAMASQYDRDAGERIEGIERVVQSLMDQSPALYAAFDRVNSVGSDLSFPSLNTGSPKSASSPSKSNTTSRAATPSMLSTESCPDGIQHNKTPALPPLRVSSRSQNASQNTRKFELRFKASIPSSLGSAPYSPATSPGELSSSEISPSEQGMWDNASSVGFPSPHILMKSPSPHIPMKSSMRHWKPPDTRPVAGRSLPPVPKSAVIERNRAEQASSLPALSTPPDSDIERQLSNRRPSPPSECEPIALPPAAWEDDKATIKGSSQYSTTPAVSQEAVLLGKHMSTISQQDNFEKEVFKNSAIYCDL
jgi:hypothetical protein